MARSRDIIPAYGGNVHFLVDAWIAQYGHQVTVERPTAVVSDVYHDAAPSMDVFTTQMVFAWEQDRDLMDFAETLEMEMPVTVYCRMDDDVPVGSIITVDHTDPVPGLTDTQRYRVTRVTVMTDSAKYFKQLSVVPYRGPGYQTTGLQ